MWDENTSKSWGEKWDGKANPQTDSENAWNPNRFQYLDLTRFAWHSKAVMWFCGIQTDSNPNLTQLAWFHRATSHPDRITHTQSVRDGKGKEKEVEWRSYGMDVFGILSCVFAHLLLTFRFCLLAATVFARLCISVKVIVFPLLLPPKAQEQAFLINFTLLLHTSQWTAIQANFPIQR